MPNKAKRVIVMSGVSGSGKSTYIERILPKGNFKIVSADYYFTNLDGIYTFNPAELSKAHAACFRNFIAALESLVPLVIVDNTNTTSEEIAPYMLGAAAFNYEAEIITLGVRKTSNDVFDIFYKQCAERNTHEVSITTIRAQQARITNRRLPPWWKETVI